MVVVGKEGMIFVVKVLSGKADGGIAEGTVSVCEAGVIAEDWLRSIVQEETARLRMRNHRGAN